MDNLKGNLRSGQTHFSECTVVFGAGAWTSFASQEAQNTSWVLARLRVQSVTSVLSWCSRQTSAGPQFLDSCLAFLLRTLLYLQKQNIESKWPLALRHKSPTNQRLSHIVTTDVRVKAMSAPHPWCWLQRWSRLEPWQHGRLPAWGWGLSGNQGRGLSEERKSPMRPLTAQWVGPTCRCQCKAGYFW